jgi:hypothetical protein
MDVSQISRKERSKASTSGKFRIHLLIILLFSTALSAISIVSSILTHFSDPVNFISAVFLPSSRANASMVSSSEVSDDTLSSTYRVKTETVVEGPAQSMYLPAQPSSMILLRAIGNALPPRHSPRQTLDNLEFTLAHEKAFPNTTRHWFVNRIVDPKVREQLLCRLRKANETYTIIPFNIQVYGQLSKIPTLNATEPNRSRTLAHRGRFAEEEKKHEKILYVINVNGVRNAMLEYGRRHTNAQYILPWDGNCFLTQNAWSAIQSSLTMHPDDKYFLSPMDRLKEPNEALLSESYKPNAVEEPQIIFHRTALARFNENLRYGRRDKVELLARIRARGPWDTALWDWQESEVRSLDTNPTPDSSADVPVAGWSVRLYSGKDGAEQPGAVALRGSLRRKAVSMLLTRLDHDYSAVNEHQRKAEWIAGMQQLQPTTATCLCKYSTCHHPT